MFCQQCGAELNEGAKFCSSCGAKIGGESDSSSQRTHDDIMEKFEKLEKLKSAGLITPEEYEKKRSALVDEL